MTALSAISCTTIRPVVFSTINESGVTSPSTIASPSPHDALIITWCRAPVIGLAVKLCPVQIVQNSAGAVSILGSAERLCSVNRVVAYLRWKVAPITPRNRA